MNTPKRPGLVKLRDYSLKGIFHGSREAYEQAQRDLVEAAIKEATADLIERRVSRAELAAACARAGVLGAIADRTLENDRKIFHLLMGDFTATMAALKETGDIEQAKSAAKTFNFEKLVALAEAAAASGSARRAAISRYTKATPKNVAKAFVFDCWQLWEAHPGQYPTTAAFARAMLDKHPDALTSQAVIEGWVRQWRKPKGNLRAD